MERETLELKSEIGRQIIYDEHEDFDVIQDTITGTGRWSIFHDIIIKRKSDGKFFKSSYSEGSTESQDEKPYEWGTAKFNEVFPIEETIIKYK